MANSKIYTAVTGTASTETIAAATITFPYLKKSHLEVRVSNVGETLSAFKTRLAAGSVTAETFNTDYSIADSGILTFVTATLADGSVYQVEVKRNSNILTRYVDFVDGSIVTEANLDDAQKQQLYVSQELEDNKATLKEDGSITADITGDVTGDLTGNADTVTTNANLTGGVTSVGNAATVVTNANLTGGVTSVGNAATVVTNANLTGEVTSSGNAATIANDIVDEANLKSDNAPTDDYVLTAKASASGGLTWSAVGAGSVTSVTAGAGMTQSGTSTINPTLDVVGGDGITANANDIAHTAHTGDVTGATALTIAADAVNGDKIADLSINSEHYVNGSIDATHIAADAVNGDKIADLSINSEHFVTGSIDTAHIAADAVNGDKIADLSINSEHFVTGSIDAAHIAADAVNGDKIADLSINSEHYINASIDNAHLADDAVDSDELAAGAVDIAHLSASGSAGSSTFLRGDNSWVTPTDTNTQLSTEEVQDIVGAMFTGNTETNTAVTYQDGDGTIDVVTTLDGAPLTTEAVQDIVGGMFSGNTETRVAATYEDGDGTIDLVVDDMTANTMGSGFTVAATTTGTGTTITQGDSLTIAAGTGITTTGTSDGVVTIASTVTDTNTMGSGFTVSATTDTNATTITQGDDLMFTAGTGISCETTADGTVTITNTVSGASTATASATGVIKIEDDTDQSVAAESVSTTANRTYGLQLNSSDQGVTNVPWTDTNTTYTAGDGLDLSGTSFSTDLKSAGGLKITSTELELDVNGLGDVGTTSFGATTFGAGDYIAVADASDSNNPKKVKFPVELGMACGDETTAITTGTAKLTFRMPHAMTLTEVRANVKTAPVGSAITIDINEGGTTIMSSTKLTIADGVKTSTTAASTPAVISDTALADDAEITIDFDAVGSGTAGAGVKIWLIGYR